MADKKIDIKDKNGGSLSREEVIKVIEETESLIDITEQSIELFNGVKKISACSLLVAMIIMSMLPNAFLACVLIVLSVCLTVSLDFLRVDYSTLKESKYVLSLFNEHIKNLEKEEEID